MKNSVKCEFYKSKEEVSEEYLNWLEKLKDWKLFVTLTFREVLSEETVKKRFKTFIWIINKDFLGKHYVRKVGHSYFSYICGMEKQERDALHFHLVVDKPLNFKLCHEVWQNLAGWALIEKIKSDEKVIKYVVKYIKKDGNVDLYIKQKDFNPMEKPAWWLLQ